MRNPELARDHVRRAAVRLRAVPVLHESESWADVVRESQEVVELALKGLLRASGIEPPRVPYVSEVLLAEQARWVSRGRPESPRLAEASRRLRRDRKLAFYGAEELTPSGFYTWADADEALATAREVVATVQPHVR
jgi:HEPN domain-containing protein